MECDEKQHKDRNASCESKKLVGQWKDINERPLVVIRFNPDSYLKYGVRHKGIFRLDKTTGGLRTRKKELERRMKQFKERIDYWLHHVPSKMITEDRLFFDT